MWYIGEDEDNNVAEEDSNCASQHHENVSTSFDTIQNETVPA